MVGFTAGDQIELDTFLSARTSPDFMKYTKNVATTLEKGTTGEVLEVKKFGSGNSGVKMKINNGPKAGASYWVYYNQKNPALKLISKVSKKEISPELVNNDEEVAAEIIRSVVAKRDLEEQALLEAARVATDTLNTNDIQSATSLLSSENCDPVSLNAPVNLDQPIAASVAELMADVPTQSMPTKPSAAPAIFEASVTEEEDKKITSGQLYGPDQALKDINSGKLEFMGRVHIISRGGQNYSCIYKNAKAYVVYNNCMGSKKEANVADLEVITKGGDYFKFYLEIYDSPKKPSMMRREDYRAGTWDMVWAKGRAPGEMNIKQFKEYMEVRSDEQAGNVCFIGGSNKVNSSSVKADCIGNMTSQKSQWAASSENFWKNPSEEWYQTQKNLRKVVVGSF